MRVLAAVELGDLARVAVAATVAGVGMTAVFSLALLAAIRSREGPGRVGWRLLSMGAGVATLALVALGVYAVAAA